MTNENKELVRELGDARARITEFEAKLKTSHTQQPIDTSLVDLRPEATYYWNFIFIGFLLVLALGYFLKYYVHPQVVLNEL